MTNPAGRTDLEVLTPREVPLGGLRAMRVRRTLPQRHRSLIGAWCFVDHYGPDEVDQTGGMVVAPHPHTGLQTVSWLFDGEIEHRDSAGNHALVRPGELNLMTAGRGISHAEVSAPDTTTLHGAQLWVALPEAARNGDPAFEHFAPSPVREGVEGVYGDEKAPVYALPLLSGFKEPTADVALHRAARDAENLRRLLRRGPAGRSEVFAEVACGFAGGLRRGCAVFFAVHGPMLDHPRCSRRARDAILADPTKG